MYLPKALFCLSFVISLVACSYGNIWAQNGLWEDPKNTSKRAPSKMENGKKSFAKWKDHLEKWGREDNFTHHLAAGGKLNSNGWSGCVYLLKRRNTAESHFFQLSFSEIEHEKQIQQQKTNKAFPEFEAGRPFVFGKIHNLYTLQLGYGREQLLLPGVIEGNLSLSFRYSGGFSLALLKPYYLKLVYTDYANNQPPVLKEERWMDENREEFLNTNRILGASKWGKGLGETRPVPGVFAEAALAIEVGNSKVLVQTISIGANAAYYPDKLPIMAELESSNFQAAVFVGLSLGKKWRSRY